MAVALATAPAAFAANPPHGSHGQETDAAGAATPLSYSLAVKQICGHALLFEGSHSIGTRTGALAVAGDIRASAQQRLALVAGVPASPAQRSTVTRWLALERRLADVYALNYVQIYDLIAAPRTVQQDTGAAHRLAGLMHAPERLRQAAALLQHQLGVPDCTGG
jgi:hypothetical protein